MSDKMKCWEIILSLDSHKSHTIWKKKPKDLFKLWGWATCSFVLIAWYGGKLKMASNHSKIFFAVLLLLSLQFLTSHKTGSTAAVLLLLSLQSLTSHKTFQVQIRGFKCLLFFCQEKWEETEKKDKWWPSLVWFRHEKREQRQCLFWLFWNKLRHKTTRFLS